MRRFLRWLFRKTFDPPIERRNEPPALRRVREDWKVAKSKANRALAEVERTERTARKG